MYKWLVFLPSKLDSSLPVANRYFGAFEDGSLKVRGIEARRHDTPPLFARCQMEILQLMAKAQSAAEVREMFPACQKVFQEYVELLVSGQADPQELVFTKRASKDAGEYEDRDTVEGSARQLLESEGRKTRAGQLVKYVITDYYRRKGRSGTRTTPVELLDGASNYDKRRYVELLTDVCNTVFRPFGKEVNESGLITSDNQFYNPS